MDTSYEELFDFLVDSGVLQADQVDGVVAGARERAALFGQILLRRRLLTVRQVIILLDAQAEQPGTRLGELAVRNGFLGQADVDDALAHQPQTRCDPLDQLLLSKLVPERVLLLALADYIKSRVRAGEEKAA